MPYRTIGSKWVKTKALLKDPGMRAFVPVTVRMNQSSLAALLKRYRMVYAKPDLGTAGNGVMRVELASGSRLGRCSFQLGLRRRAFASYGAMYSSLSKATRGKPYIAQKGIHLLKINGRRFDIRVMVQMDPRGNWETTGIIARIAHPKKIVTNYHNGGTAVSVNWLFAKLMSKSKGDALIERLKRLGVKTGRRMGRSYPGMKEIGIDVGLDASGRPWIIEVNTRPDLYIFKELKDRSVFRKMYAYAKANKRFKTKKTR